MICPSRLAPSLESFGGCVGVGRVPHANRAERTRCCLHINCALRDGSEREPPIEGLFQASMWLQASVTACRRLPDLRLKAAEPRLPPPPLGALLHFHLLRLITAPAVAVSVTGNERCLGHRPCACYAGATPAAFRRGWRPIRLKPASRDLLATGS